MTSSNSPTGTQRADNAAVTRASARVGKAVTFAFTRRGWKMARPIPGSLPSIEAPKSISDPKMSEQCLSIGG